MTIIFKNRYGFYDEHKNKYIGFVYEDIESNRVFSVAKKTSMNLYFINELDETFGPNDNTYSTLSANSLDEARNTIKNILEGKL